ncbi:MAG: hypothetical protein HKN09_11825 [Saprospiraceae bacterium]|nr:hypothetical protein [Saprospiraceae bacterium]
MKKIIRFILGIVLLVLIAYLVVITLPKAKIDNAEVDYVIGATELYEQYEADEQKANASYLGKIIEVQGKIQMIEEDQAGATVIILNCDDGFGGVMCTLAEGSKARLFEVNQDITIIGLCTGKLMDVVLNKCVVVYG